MRPRRGFLTATVLAALLNGGAALADEPAGTTVQSDTATTPTSVPAVHAADPASAVPASSAPAVSPQSGVPAVQQATPLAPATRVASPVASNTSSMVSGLIFLVLLILGAAWLIRRTGGMPALRGGSSMKVVAALSVGPRERVVLVELGGQQWLLGVGSGSVNTLHHFEQPIVVDNTDDFAGKLRQLWPQGPRK